MVLLFLSSCSGPRTAASWPARLIAPRRSGGRADSIPEVCNMSNEIATGGESASAPNANHINMARRPGNLHPLALAALATIATDDDKEELPVSTSWACRKPPEEMTASDVDALLGWRAAELAAMAYNPDPIVVRGLVGGLRGPDLFHTLRRFADAWIDRRVAQGGSFDELWATMEGVQECGRAIGVSARQITPPALIDENGVREAFAGQVWSEEDDIRAARYVEWVRAGGPDSGWKAEVTKVKIGGLLQKIPVPADLLPVLEAIQHRNEEALPKHSPAMKLFIDKDASFERKLIRRRHGAA